jgi:hypothetical protein
MNTKQLMPANRLQEKAMIHEMTSELEASPSRGLTSPIALTTSALLLVGFATVCLARPSGQTTFASPEDASRALLTAVEKSDDPGLMKILGTGAELLTSGDKAQDSFEREWFVEKYQEMHRLVQEPGGVTALYVGAENWPFPVPLVAHGGVWRFDPDAGTNEVRFRRIGENEVTAIGMCHALVAAETHPGADAEAVGLVKTVLPNVGSANAPVPFHGYYFRILSKSDGGFAAIAYPAAYRSSGVVTFIVNQDDVVYQKDLGRNTVAAADRITSYQSGPTWTPAESIP